MLNQTNRFLLKCVFRYSANASTAESARKLLLAASTGDEEDFERQVSFAGGFIEACLKGDVIDAWFKADSCNRLALEIGMKDLFKGGKIFNEGLDPKEFMGGK